MAGGLVSSTLQTDPSEDDATRGNRLPVVRFIGALYRSTTGQEVLTFVAFSLLFLVFTIWLGGRFANVGSRVLDIWTNAPVILLALAEIVTLRSGQFDLSISGNTTLTAFLTIGLVVNQGLPLWAAIVAALAAGALVGAVNSVLVSIFGINAFIATLATNGACLGLADVYSGGSAVAASTDNPLPQWFTTFGSFTGKCPAWLLWTVVVLIVLCGALSLRAARPARIQRWAWEFVTVGCLAAGLAVAVLVFNLPEWIRQTSWVIALLLLVALALWVLLEYTPFGRNLTATGANREAARLAGVPTRRVEMIAFPLSGLLSAIAGTVLAAQVGSAQPDLGSSLLLPAFAAGFLSTVLFSRGQFNVWGAVVGGVFLVWVNQALLAGGVAFTWNQVVNGAVLIVAVGFSSTLAKWRA
jgi:ribose/xylose/arabinose/galactoside ABC-type transport system permease subunit